MKRIWLVAAENGALPGGKVGGVGDVIRELPQALVETGLALRVVTPSYGVFHKLPGASLHRKLEIDFAGATFVADVYRLPCPTEELEYFVIEHPRFSPHGPGQIYISDEPGQAFAADTAKFAFFSALLVNWANESAAPPDVLHLHDWHMGLIPALRRFGKPDTSLSRARIVFTIHNMAYQGVRPFQGVDSSLQAWFPELLEHSGAIKDPEYDDCVNFMASAIRLADRINTVSPNYAREIQLPGDPSAGFSGGEGLEAELRKAAAEGRLVGILNGCMYPQNGDSEPAWDEILALLARQTDLMISNLSAADWLAARKCKRPRHLLLSIGRIVAQKVPLFLEPVAGHASALEAILGSLGPDALFIMLGSGDKAFEDRFAAIARSSDNFLFLRGYAEALSGPLYAAGDLFLMPSSFEPCGISQMLAMREGQPCVVHGVGGLKDTVKNAVTGFVFGGDNPAQQAEEFVRSTLDAIAIKSSDQPRWQEICRRAAAERFSWHKAAREYRHSMYFYA